MTDSTTQPSILQANIQHLMIRHADLVTFLTNRETPTVEIPLETDEEVHATLNKIPWDRDIVLVLFGIGGGRVLTELSHRVRPGQAIMAYEADEDWFTHLCHTTDLSTVLAVPSVHLFTKTTAAGMHTWCQQYMQRTNAGVFLLTHPSAFAANRDTYNEAKRHYIDYPAIQGQVRHATLDAFGNLFLENYTKNLADYAMASPNTPLKGVGAGRPIFVCGSGPSLTQALPLLKDRPEAIILAADSALRLLVTHKIFPHMITSVDPQPMTSVKLTSTEQPQDTVLLFHPNTNPGVVSAWKGPKMATDCHMPLYSRFQAAIPTKGSLEKHIHCQLHMAFNVAELLGGSPIILVGSDLCYKANRMHAQGTSYLDFAAPGDEHMVTTNGVIKVTNKDGLEVTTSPLFQSYQNMWTTKLKECPVEVYNISEGGLHIEGALDLTVAEMEQHLLPRPLERLTLPCAPHGSDLDGVKVALHTLIQDCQRCAKLAVRLHELVTAAKIAPTPQVTARAERLALRLQRETQMIDVIQTCHSQLARRLSGDKALMVDRELNPRTRLKHQLHKTRSFATAFIKSCPMLIEASKIALGRLS